MVIGRDFIEPQPQSLTYWIAEDIFYLLRDPYLLGKGKY